MYNVPNYCHYQCTHYCVTEAGGSDVNPEHEPHVPKGGITAEMQVSVTMVVIYPLVLEWSYG